MKYFVLVFFPLLALHLSAKEPEVFTDDTEINGTTFQLKFSEADIKNVPWDYNSNQNPPVTPKHAEELAIASLYKIRPSSEKWEAITREFSFGDKWAVYYFNFRLMIPKPAKYTSLAFWVTMDGKILSPRPLKAEQDAAANP
jgi:hypothetical protein